MVLVVVAVLILFFSGVFDFLHDREKVEDFFQDSGVLGPIIYILAFVAAQRFAHSHLSLKTFFILHDFNRHCLLTVT